MDQPDIGPDRRAVGRGGYTGQCHRGQATAPQAPLHQAEGLQVPLDGAHADRNRQFENIARLKREYLESDNPILSIDTKKKEFVGKFYREGRLTPRDDRVFDHDFPSAASGVIIPYGMYDVSGTTVM